MDTQILLVDKAYHLTRIDRFIYQKIRFCSLNQIRRLIKLGGVQILKNKGKNLPSPNTRAQLRDLVEQNDQVWIDFKCFEVRTQEQQKLINQRMQKIRCLYSTPHWSVFDKPAGIHCLPVYFKDTLHLAYLLGSYCSNYVLSLQEKIPDYGLIHRLDGGTSGVILVAHSLAAYEQLIKARQQQQVWRIYWALIKNRPTSSCIQINTPIAHHSKRDSLMVAILNNKTSYRGQPQQACTQLKTLQTSERHALVQVSIQGGRRHQIRVHLASLGLPILGDSDYDSQALACFRFALHARYLNIHCPLSQTQHCIESIPQDDFWQLAPELKS